MKEKAFLSILNKKFPGGACPQTPLAAWALRAQVTRPKGIILGLRLLLPKQRLYKILLRTLDSKVVLGYIANESRQFYVYVANRVQLIRSLSTPEQWRYVESEQNPADLATRRVPTNKLMESSWLKGPEFLKKPESTPKLMKRSH